MKFYFNLKKLNIIYCYTRVLILKHKNEEKIFKIVIFSLSCIFNINKHYTFRLNVCLYK